MSKQSDKCHTSLQGSRGDSFLEDVVQRIRDLPYDRMEEWLRAVLHGKDTLLPDRGEISRARLLHSIYPHLPRTVREDMLKATTGLLKDLLQSGLWTNEAADELLLLLQYLAPEDSCAVLEAAATTEAFRNFEEHRRFVFIQTLISLGVTVPPDFWYSLLTEDPNRFAGISFDGLARISLNRAIQILPLLPDDEGVAELIGNALPGLVKDAGAGGIRRIGELISAILLEIPSAVRREIQEYFDLEGFPLELPGESDFGITHAELEKALWTMSTETYASRSQPICATI